MRITALLPLAALLAAGCATSNVGPPSSPPVILRAEDARGRLDAGEGTIPLGASAGFSAGVARMTEPLPGHLHRVRSEVVIVLGGSGEITLGGDRRQLEPGMMVFVPPGVYHSVTPGPEGVDVTVVRIPPTGEEDVIPVR